MNNVMNFYNVVQLKLLFQTTYGSVEETFKIASDL